MGRLKARPAFYESDLAGAGVLAAAGLASPPASDFFSDESDFSDFPADDESALPFLA